MKKLGKRQAQKTRKTSETEISVRLNLDGIGTAKVKTGIPFFDHMLNLFARHGLLDLEVKAKGDLDVDLHHTVEDVGLVLGQVLAVALGKKEGICRYGCAHVPMDETLALKPLPPSTIFSPPPPHTPPHSPVSQNPPPATPQKTSPHLLWVRCDSVPPHNLLRPPPSSSLQKPPPHNESSAQFF